MRRTGFKRPQLPARERSFPSVTPGAFRLGTQATECAAPVEKDEPVRSEAYRYLVAMLPCKLCGIAGYSQAAHPNTGKGAGIKTDDRLCFPLCTVHPDQDGNLVQGCHELFDQHALLPKIARRAIEPVWAADTRRQIIVMGLWPANLPVWSES